MAGNPAARRGSVWAASLLLPGSYDWFKACAMSAIRSDGCSMPIDSRIVESRTPIFWRISAGIPEWVMLAGRQASDCVSLESNRGQACQTEYRRHQAFGDVGIQPAPLATLKNKPPLGKVDHSISIPELAE